MIRRRLYNPAQLTPSELKASFVAREETLTELLHVIGGQRPDRPCQHMMLIGPRGMGKTTLGLRFLYAVEDDSNLAAQWQPVVFHEESYGIGNLAEFWLAALQHLTRATGDPRWADRAESLAEDEGDTQRLAAYALAALLDFNEASGKRLILFVENLDAIFEQLRSERELHALRASLIEHREILLLGSANAVFEAIRSYGQPFYEFFRVFTLEGLEPADARRMLEAVAYCEDRPEIPETLNREHGRLETIRRLTGGNPRLLVLSCRMLIESPLGSAIEDLEQLIDEQTPYFKARIEDLPVQARKVFHCLSEGWKPMLAKEVAGAAKLSSSHASAQLKQLLEKGYAREVRLPGGKRARYEVSDRFYNIYYLLRFSRTGRDRLERLVAFLHDLFGPAGMRTMYPAALNALRVDGVGTAASELLGVLAPYVAGDPHFEGREDWQREALAIVADRVGPNAPIIQVIREEFADREGADEERAEQRLILRWIKQSVEFTEAGCFKKAEGVLRKVLEIRSDHYPAWFGLGSVLFSQHRLEEAVTAFDRVLECVPKGGPKERRLLTFLTLIGKGMTLIELKQLGKAIAAIEHADKYSDPDDSIEHRDTAAAACETRGRVLAQLNREEEAIAAWQQASEHIRTDDPAELRQTAARAIAAGSHILGKLGRGEEAVTTREQVAKYIHPDDPEDLRRLAVNALAANSSDLVDRSRYKEAAGFLERLPEYIRADDSAEMRHLAVATAGLRGFVLSELGNHDHLSAGCRLAGEYVHRDDPIKLRRITAKALASEGHMLNLHGRYSEMESVCRRATDIDPDCDESWIIWAQAILNQNDTERLPESEEHARRAVELGPKNPEALRTLSNILARRGDWTEALDQLEHALRIAGNESQEQELPGLTESLIRAVAAGHGRRVKNMMDAAGLAESMEPLWHAIRAELGEELEPLPAEIMMAVTEIRQRFSATNPGSQP